MKKSLFNGVGALLGCLLLYLSISSCKKYADPPPYFEEQGDTTRPVARKVLVIGIDGAVGSEYKTIAPPTLMSMKTHSKYSWDALSDASTTDAASWKTLMTGVSYQNHHIHDSSFIYTQQSGDQHGAIASYPSVFSYVISSARSNLRTSFVSQWSTLVNSLVPEVEDKVHAANDVAVKDSALVRIKNEKSDVVIVHFNSVAVAGRASGFSAASNDYKNAVLQVDGYINELMTALKARPGYQKSEQWLVVVTGTHGGSGNTYGGSSPAETNVVSFYYNEDFKELELTKPAFSGVQLKGRDAAAIKATLPNDGGLYNAGNGEQTIQLKIKGPNPGSWPHFFTRQATWPSTSGWSWFAAGTNWSFSVRSTTTGERRIQTATPPVFDDKWHTLTVVIYDSVVNGVNTRWVKRFTDGVRIIETGGNETARNLGSNYGSIESASPMLLGWGGDKGMGAVTFHAADVMIFNKALTDAEVKNNLCLQDITQHPKYANLIGYWPMNDGGFSKTARNLAPGSNRPDFVFDGSFAWNGAEAPCASAGPGGSSAQMLVKSVDLAANFFYWLRIPVATSWRLEGAKWLEQYEIEFVKL
jgi:hypothetical protein